MSSASKMNKEVNTILKKVREELEIPKITPSMCKIYEKIIEKERPQTIFITNDKDGNMIELVRKPPPYVPGERMFKKKK
jgi:hypothetical protein